MTLNQTDPQSLRVLSLQPALQAGNMEHNLDLVREAVSRQAALQPIDLILLPECFTGVFDDESRRPSSLARDFLSDLAATHGTAIVGGSMERLSKGGALLNTTFCYDDRGTEVVAYDKQMLFSREARRRVPGDAPAIFEFRGWRIGILICADLWYPELARENHCDLDVLCVPAETVVPAESFVVYARTAWIRLALIRALENAIAVVVSDWAQGELRKEQSTIEDRAEETHYTSGGSSIVDPSARPDVTRLQVSLDDGGSGELRATLDRERIRQFRAYRRSVGLLPRLMGDENAGGPASSGQATGEDETSGGFL